MLGKSCSDQSSSPSAKKKKKKNKEDKEFVKHGLNPGAAVEAGEQSYLTFNYSEIESLSCLTTVTNFKGPTNQSAHDDFGVNYHLGAD
jgi:hypothetical protein